LKVSLKAPIICIIFFVNCFAIVYSQVYVPDENELMAFEQRQRFKHDLSLYSSIYPFRRQKKEDNTNTGIDIGLMKTDSSYIPVLSTWVSATANKWTWMLNSHITTSKYGHELLGSSFEEAGYTGRVISALLRYESHPFSVHLGRSPIWWGQSWKNSIILSGRAPSFDYYLFNLQFSILRLEFFGGQLHKERIKQKTITRWISGHRLNLQLKNKLYVEVGEIIIYSGENRHFEMYYANPLTSYLATDLDGESQLPFGVNNDNIIIFLNGRFNLKENLSIYGELIIDDFQVHGDPKQDLLGFKIGIDGVLSTKRQPITFDAEFTQINSWTYIHPGEHTSYHNRKHSLGYQYGPDCASFRIQINFWIDEKLLIDFEYSLLQKGNNSLSTPSANHNTINDTFPTLPTALFHIGKISASYLISGDTVFKAGWSGFPFTNEISYEGDLEVYGAFYLKLQKSYSFNGF